MSTIQKCLFCAFLLILVFIIIKSTSCNPIIESYGRGGGRGGIGRGGIRRGGIGRGGIGRGGIGRSWGGRGGYYGGYGYNPVYIYNDSDYGYSYPYWYRYIPFLNYYYY
jgi:hypothetical protein